jgi:HAMP domain-containing protein
MKLALKFNLALLATIALGMAATGFIGQRILQAKARHETEQSARLLLEAAMATRGYTNTRVHKLLENQMKYDFLAESVPSFAATEVLKSMQASFADYHYKEATLNPTNPRDRVVDWEADVVQMFRRDDKLPEVVGERDTPAGRSLYLARPIAVKDEACLQCHSTAAAAPKTLVDKYGPSNGFGWKLNEVVGAQIVSVPSTVHTAAADRAFRALMAGVAVVFAAVFVVLNLLLTLLVVRPATKLAAIAEQASLDGSGNAASGSSGNAAFGVEASDDAFGAGRRDEIGDLARAIGRLRTSLRKAMSLVDT